MASKVVRVVLGSAWLFLCMYSLFEGGSTTDSHVYRAELVTIGYMLASVALSLLANYLLAPDIEQKTPIKDDKPSTTVTRGSFIPRIWGEARIGPTVCWVGNRETETEGGGGGGGKGGGGGGGGGGGITIYYEEAIHVLCIGPAYKLKRIWSDGTVISEGTIDRVSHPSGSVIDLDDGNEYEIYWGDGNGPTSTWVYNRIGVDGKWPYICMILWKNKRLGTAARWPSLEYEIQCRPYSQGIETTRPWIFGAFTDTGNVFDIEAGTDGDPGDGVFKIAGDHLDLMQPGEMIRIEGNGVDDGVYEIFNADYNSSSDRTRIYMVEPVEGSDDNGTITYLKQADAGGANYAHVIYELLFAGYPHGLALDVEDFDLSSLSELGEICYDEGIGCSIIAKDGETVKGILAAIMMDVGFMISLDPITGLYRFVVIRKPNSEDDVLAIPADALLGPAPEIATDIDERETDRIQFTFRDRKKNHRDKTIIFDNDGQADELGYKKMKNARLSTVLFYNVAKKVAARRQQEELAAAVAIDLQVARSLRNLYPGRLVSVDELDVSLRIMAMEQVPLSGMAKLSCIEDFYGVAPSSLDSADDEEGEEEDLEEIEFASAFDEGWDFFELPKAISPGVPSISPLHVRSTSLTSTHATWLSLDDTTYTALSRHGLPMTGGTLDEELPAAGKFKPSTGPTFTAAGVDIAKVLDLSGDDVGWRSGRLWAVFVSASGEVEIAFAQGVTALGGDTFRLDGLLRARYDTVRLTHPADTFVYLVDSSRLLALKHANLIPGKTIYVKNQPYSPGAVQLSRVTPLSRTFEGTAVVPRPLTSLRGVRRKGQPNSYLTGEDITVKWSVRPGSRLSGAGWTLAGNASEAIEHEGVYVIEYLTTGDELKYTARVRDAAETTLENADLVSYFGSEPSAFKVRAHHVLGGFSGSSSEITITKR